MPCAPNVLKRPSLSCRASLLAAEHNRLTAPRGARRAPSPRPPSPGPLRLRRPEPPAVPASPPELRARVRAHPLPAGVDGPEPAAPPLGVHLAEPAPALAASPRPRDRPLERARRVLHVPPGSQPIVTHGGTLRRAAHRVHLEPGQTRAAAAALSHRPGAVAHGAAPAGNHRALHLRITRPCFRRAGPS
jgi:hypothetical protein